MNVKGISLINIGLYVKKLHPSRYDEWYAALPADSQKVMQGVVLPTGWYPVEAALIQPTVAICNLFFGGREEGAFKTGEFNADLNLTGIYQLFFKLGSPRFLLDKATSIAQKMYDPSPTLELAEYQNGRALVRYHNTSTNHWVMEQRIAGFAKRGLELSGCKDVKMEFLCSMSKGAPTSDVVVTWRT